MPPTLSAGVSERDDGVIAVTYSSHHHTNELKKRVAAEGDLSLPIDIVGSFRSHLMRAAPDRTLEVERQVLLAVGGTFCLIKLLAYVITEREAHRIVSPDNTKSRK
jgi:hypothetical protein